jgi:tetratricopeptide (TPR) repeat protein
MRRLLAVLILFAVPVCAEERFAYAPPDESLITVKRGIAYSKTRAGDLTFDLYTPKNADRAPVVIFANIGSLAYPTWPIYIGWGKAVASAGLAGVVYQATIDKMIENFDEVMEHLRRNAAELHVDPSRVVVWSGSSNVRIGLPLAMDAKRDYIRGAAVFYGATDVPSIRADLPVFFVRSGLDVPALNKAIDALAQKALAANAPWTIESYGSGLHGFEVLNDNDLSRLVISRSLRFMNEVTAPAMRSAYAAGAADAALAAAFTREEWDTAIAGYSKRVDADPANPDAQLRLGLSLLGAKRHAEALTSLEKAFDLGRRGPRDTGYPAARAAAGAGNVARTVHWLDYILNTNFGPPLEEVRTSPDFALVRNDPAFREVVEGVEEQRRLVDMIANSDKAGDGLRMLAESKRERYQHEAVLNAMGYGVMNNHRYSESAAIFELNTKRHPESANAWDSYSEALERAGRKEEALAAARKVLQLSNESTPANVRSAAEARVKRLTSS